MTNSLEISEASSQKERTDLHPSSEDLGKCASAERRITGVNLRIVIQAIKNESGLQAVPGDDMLGALSTS